MNRLDRFNNAICRHMPYVLACRKSQCKHIMGTEEQTCLHEPCHLYGNVSIDIHVIGREEGLIRKTT